MTPTPLIERLAIVGVGLIGGSLALALREAGLVRQVVGTGRRRASLERALTLGVIDEIAASPEEAVRGADLVLLAIPVGAMAALMQEIAPHLAEDAVLTDAGSTKQDVIAAARAALGARIGQFVPGHPIAGAERNGVSAARPDLFRDKDVILTPLPENPVTAVEQVAAMWRGCGAKLEYMNEEQHDRIFAAVSHVPHFAAFALMEELAGREQRELFYRHAGTGFRDFTRIAASHPEMWRDIALANREAILAELDAYIAKLGEIRVLVERGDGPALEALLERASLARNAWTTYRSTHKK